MWGRFQLNAFAAGAILAVSVTTSARAGSLTVDLEAVPCPDPTSIARAVEKASTASFATDATLVLLVRPADPGSLSLRLIGTGNPRTRTIPFTPHHCAALPGALSLIVDSWVSHRLLESSVARIEVVDARPTDQQQEIAVVAPPPPAPRSRARALVSLAVLGGAHYAAQLPAPAWALSLFASVAPPNSRWGGTLMGGYRGAVNSRESWGSLGTDSGLLAALAMARFEPGESLRLELFAGPALEALRAQARVLGSTRSTTLTTLAGLGSVQLRGFLGHGGLGWVAAIDLVVRPRFQEVIVDQTAVRRIEPWGMSAQVGLFWDAS